MNDKKITLISWILFGLLMVVGYKFLLLPYGSFLAIVIFLIFQKSVSLYQEKYQEKQRTIKLQEIAITMGLDFYKKGDEQIVPIVQDMQVFQGIKPVMKNLLNDFRVSFCTLARIFLPLIGLNILFELNMSGKVFSGIETRKIRNIFKGKKQEVLVMICDFYTKETKFPITKKTEFTSADADPTVSVNVSVTKSSQTVIVFVSENLHLPEFSLTKTNKIGKSLGHSQSQPQFSKLYNLQAREQIYYQQIFSERIRAFYEAEQNLCTEAKGDRLICYRANTIIQPQEMQSFLETGFRALELFKEKTQEIASAYTTPSASRDDSNDFSSARRINYTKLQDLLQAGKWKEADQETTAIMLYILSIEEDGSAIEGAFDTESMTKFPCTDLHTIDQLWMKYSQGRFGFSVQKEIWQNLGGQPDKYHWKETIAVNRITWQFMGRVGWSKFSLLRKYDKLIFTLDAPPGHLPVLWGEWTIGGYAAPLDRWKLFSRMETCAKQFSS
ncbi:GUN4 domain-containing protein [Scytonema sp. PCC 10023]|uniref:GUN4 domain-containing protein n=1 Tax=Scytonema sp. PCC 10023 TaxID=1680591 RepID=UPI0039C6533D